MKRYLTHTILAVLVALGGSFAAAADVPTGDTQANAAGDDNNGSSSSSGSADTAEAETGDEDIAEIESLLQEELDRRNAGEQISFETNKTRAELVTKEQPAWLSLAPENTLVDHKDVVASKLYFTAQETESDLDMAMRKAVNRYINGYLDDDKAAMLVRIDNDYIRNNLVAEQFDEVWNVKEYNRNMYRRHALLDFNDSFRSRLDAEWRDVTQTSKLLTTGLAAFGVLGLLGVAFTYLRLDSATKGYYSGRLQFMSAVAILALAAAGALFANVNADWLRWM